jgi:hypothetical protein
MTTNTSPAAALSDRVLHLALQQARPGGAIQAHLYVELETRLAARDAADEAAFDDAARAERDYERYLEDRGYDEARFQEDMEARMGIF